MELGSADVVHRSLSFQFLQEITDSFSDERKLGSGAYGIVYKGDCQDGETIAVKVLHNVLQFDDKAFDKEYLHLSRLQHKNIVRVVAYCHETKRECVLHNGELIFADNIQRALCFEYMQNGSLHNYLSDESTGHNWQTRYQIIKGICEGLKYLHEGSKTPMYHLDLKPANVLLDQNLVPKIADFGVSRLIVGGKTVDQDFLPDFGMSSTIGGEKTLLTKSGVGTRGYQPPEYIDEGLISDKFDIFSLGVVIIMIMTGPMGYFRTAEMSCQKFIELVHANWRNRLLAMSDDTLLSSSIQIKKCIELALRCVEANRCDRPRIGVICRKLTETEDMIRIDELREDACSSMYPARSQSFDSESNEISDRVSYYPNYVTISRDHIIGLFNSNKNRLYNVPENPWILKAGTKTFVDPCELTNETSTIWAMKLKTTAELVGLSGRELHEQNWVLCEEVREKCFEQLLEVAHSFSNARWSAGQIWHQLIIFDALVHVLFSIRALRFDRSREIAGILNNMMNAFKVVIQQISPHKHSIKESTIDPATVALVQVLRFFSRNRDMVQSILESGDYDSDHCSGMLNIWVCKLEKNTELIFQEKGKRSIFILNNVYYILKMVCRPGELLPDAVSNLQSLIHRYTVNYLNEYWLPPVLLYLDGDSLKKPRVSSLDRFVREFFSICHCQMSWKVQVEPKHILRKEIANLVVPKYVNFVAALQENTSLPWKSWLMGKSRTRSGRSVPTGEEMEHYIRSLFET